MRQEPGLPPARGPVGPPGHEASPGPPSPHGPWRRWAGGRPAESLRRGGPNLVATLSSPGDGKLRGLGPLPATRPTFTATFERAESGTWVVALVEEPNVHGYGDTLVEARRNIRDAITSLFGPFGAEEDDFDLVEDVRLPEAVLTVVARAQAERTLANRRREDARVAEMAVATATEEALVATRQAAAMVVEQGEAMRAVADTSGLTDDVRIPELVLQAVERAHLARQAARDQDQMSREAREIANATASEAIVTNREAARLLTGHCGLSRPEAAGLLGVSAERVQRLLTG